MRKCKREGYTFGTVRRSDVPPIMIGEAEVTFFIDGAEVAPSSMIVRLDCSRGGSTRLLKFFCKKNALGMVALNEEGWFNVVGLYDSLLRLTDQTYVRDWHWDHTTRVIGGSGAGEKPKRAKDNTVVVRVDEYQTRVIETGELIEREHVDVVVSEAKYNATPKDE